ncbi:hypothetical protein GKJPGBOP_04442 [Streptomyces paromomycinus]|uniref:Uncharacterized protein n=1 Tax=Streptomyces paromomycinus TaxID=92743 RepID=A0A401W612_STREY|nr:hypothetical protein GKJPGBOP_04442 [Streptomyces paromomycinus]
MKAFAGRTGHRSRRFREHRPRTWGARVVVRNGTRPPLRHRYPPAHQNTAPAPAPKKLLATAVVGARTAWAH